MSATKAMQSSNQVILNEYVQQTVDRKIKINLKIIMYLN